MLPATNDGICEIALDIEAKKSESVNLLISNKSGESVTMKYDVGAHTLSFDRRESGIVDFSQDFPAVTVSPTFEDYNKISLRIFVDKSSIEVFGNDGNFVMTNLVFPTTPYTTLAVSAKGRSARITNLSIFPIKVK